MTKSLKPFTRRHFLKTALLASGALVATPLGRARAQALKDVTVIVVGAGIAGLSAAQSLKKQGATVIVVEARDRIGGRLLTDWSLGKDAPFEVGAGWIHGPSPDNPIKQLADSVGGQYFVTEDENLTVFDPDGTEWDDAERDEADEDWADLLHKLDEELETNDRSSMYDAIRSLSPASLKDPGVMWALSAYTEFSKGGPIENLSAVLFDDDKAFPTADVVMANGYDSILPPLADGLDIRLGMPVSAIKYDEDEGVEVTTASGAIKGDYVICSVPLGVLKKGEIAFDPALPRSTQKKIDGLGLGSVTKLAMKFDQPFWDIETQYFGVATEEKGRWNYWVNYRTFSAQNILLGLSVGAYAPIADQMTEAERVADGMKVLRGVWGEAVPDPIQVLSTHWWTEPYTWGAYSYAAKGGSPSQFDDLSDELLEDRLIFCGEHTTFDYAATTHGALMTGMKAAERVIKEAA